jgi:formylglycine-generating enzyme required for sulfatase activity
MARIFISYRRKESDIWVGRLADELRRHFPPDEIFQDVTSIDPGAPFKQVLKRALESAAAMLVVIGPQWLTATDRLGRRRLEQPGDWVRQEVAESLRRPGVRVFPLLVNGAEPPAEEDLPEPLKPLVERQAFELSVRHWVHDVAQLVHTLRRVYEDTAREEERKRREFEERAAREDARRRKEVEQATTPARPHRSEKISALTAAPKGPPGKKISALTPAPEALPPGNRIAALATAEGPSPAETAAVPTRLASRTEFRDADGPLMVVIPAGEFMMGSPVGEEGRYDREGPQHKVTIPRSFAVGKYQVTFDERDACVATGRCTHKPGDQGWGRGRRAVINVSWEDAQAFVSWLSKRTGKHYRLLSEAEWEYAARAGTTTRYPWGDEPGSNRANFRDSGSPWSDKQTAPVGSFEANAFGLHDMIGNVWEWVQDCFNRSYRSAPADGAAWESGDCGLRMLRGGSWLDSPTLARSAYRLKLEPGFRSSDVGIRVARTL